MRFVDEHPNDSIVVYAYAHWLDAVRHMNVRMEYLDELRARVNVEDSTLSSMMARALLIKNYAELGDTTRAKIHMKYLLRDVNFDRIDALLADDLVLDGVKEHMLHHVGKAHLGRGNHDEARQTFEQIRDYYLPTGDATDNAAYYLAEIVMRTPDLEPYDRVLALQLYLDRHPEGNNVGNVLRKMANVYIENGDYLNGIDILDEIQTRKTSDRMKGLANEQANFILRNMAAEIEYQEQERLQEMQLASTFFSEKESSQRKPTDADRILNLAQACGPMAVQGLLELYGLESDLETLVLSAGVTDAGTSMADLVRVSKDHGLDLRGVEFASLDDASYPFIAFVNDDHFVLVEKRDGDELLIQDRTAAPELRSIESFEQSWNGYALVVPTKTQLATDVPTSAELSAETLSATMGGDGSPVINCITDDCREDNLTQTPSSGYMARDADGDGNYSSASSKLNLTVGGNMGFYQSPCEQRKMNWMNGSSGNGSGAKLKVRAMKPCEDPVQFPIENAARGGFETQVTDIFTPTVGGLTLEFGRVYVNNRGFDRILGRDWKSQSDFGMIWTHNYNRYVRVIENAGTPDGPEVIKVFGNTGESIEYERHGGTFMGLQFYTQDGNSISDGETYVYRNDSNGTFGLKKADGSEIQYYAPGYFSDGRGRIKAITSKGYSNVALTFTYVGDDLTRVDTPSSDNRYLEIEYCTTTGGGCFPGMIKAAYLIDNTYGNIRKVEYEYTTLVDDTYPNEPATRYFLEYVTDDGDTAHKTKYGYEKHQVKWDHYSNYSVPYHAYFDPTDSYKTYDPSKIYTTGFPGHYDLNVYVFSLRSIQDKMGNTYLIDYVYYNTPQYTDPKFDYVLSTPDGNYTHVAYDATGYQTIVRTKNTAQDVLQKTSHIANGSHSRSVRHYENDSYFQSSTDTYSFNTTNNQLAGINSTVYETEMVNGEPEIVSYGPYDFVHLDYDAENRVNAVTAGANSAAGGPTWTVEYEAGTAGPTAIVDPMGVPFKIEYDSTTNRPVKIKAPGMKNAPAPNDGVVFGWDSVGNMNTVTDEFGETWTLEYNSRGQVTKMKNPLSDESGAEHFWEMQYNWKGQLTKTISPLNDTDNAVVEYEYATTNCATCAGIGTLTKIKRFTDATNFLAISAEYDHNGNVTKMIYPDGKSTKYVYDNQNRVTEVDYLNDGLKKTTYVYNELSQVESATGPDGKTYDYTYDHMGRFESVVDAAVPTAKLVEYFYNGLGMVTKVQDKEQNAWDYTYDSLYRLTKTKSPDTGGTPNYMRYFYDDGFRLTKVAGGDEGTTEIDPVVYHYELSGPDPRGLLSKVAYTNGGTTVESHYHYSPEGRYTKTTDWIDPTGPGNEYFYDALGRVTKVADYDYDDVTDTSAVDYEYDYAGRVTQVSDLHENITSYVYTNLNQLDTMTAPGNKTWDYDYDNFGRSTKVTYPNLMSSTVDYDPVDGAVTKISHKANGGAVKQSFEYTYNDVYDIDTLTHEDGSRWDYTYDDRYRLSTATRSNAAALTSTIHAEYEYTYDDADNLVTKVTPFEDDFNDGVVAGNGWLLGGGTWNVTADGMAKNDVNPSSTPYMYQSTTDADNEIRFSYVNHHAHTVPTEERKNQMYVSVRYVNSSNYVRVYLQENQASIYQKDAGVTSDLDINDDADSDPDTLYHVRIVSDDNTMTVYRAEDGEAEEQILTTSSVTELGTGKLYLVIRKQAQFSIDNIRILSDDLDTTTTYAYNDANELTSMTDYNGVTSFEYDDLGRTTKKTLGSYVADYTWAPGDFLESVTSTFPDEGDVEYTYTGGGGRLERIDSTTGEYTWYNGNSDEDEDLVTVGDGNLTRSYYGNADIPGNNPTADARYYMTDHLGSTRSVWDENGDEVASFEYTPFGESFTESGPEDITVRYTGHDWDETAQLYYAPFRYYSPGTARWMKPDPLGMVDGPNMYAYVFNNPINYTDPWGLESYDGATPDPTDTTVDDVQVALGLIGEIPGFGIPADLTNATISFARGNYIDGGIDLLAAIPLVGNYFGGLNIAKRMRDLGKRIGKKLKEGYDKYGPKKFPTPRCNCFTEETEVLTEDGEIPIVDVDIGDRVWTLNEETGAAELKVVTALFTREAPELYLVSVGEDRMLTETATLEEVLLQPRQLLEDDTIRTTADHPFYVEDEGWTEVQHLEVGDELISYDGKDRFVAAIKIVPQPETVYNFSVEGNRNYYVSDDGILVHNCPDLPGRNGALREAKRGNDIPMNKHPDRVVKPNTPEGRDLGLDNKRNVELYEYTNRHGEPIHIRHDRPASYGDGGIGDQGPHFNAGPAGPNLPQHFYYR
jgi:RHS repeat-associated protein